ncbi:hypothetical protein BL253_33805 [Pseudofrankia asymbiotica]|uniref:Uncharacterized protein n=1 Tax=Pseudofrankia asymbiotica TaxID=1834516 RepID=A0A1V2I105_9ACTN|nr:hypothetical protein BL253_33805 [Pseudofrankia asymbiotica]
MGASGAVIIDVGIAPRPSSSDRHLRGAVGRTIRAKENDRTLIFGERYPRTVLAAYRDAARDDATPLPPPPSTPASVHRSPTP